MKSVIVKIIILVTLFGSHHLWGQQEAQYTQFMANPYVYNPALSGAEDYWSIKGGYRNQWTGIPGAPRTYYLGFHGPISKRHINHARGDKEHQRHSLGGLIVSDKAGDISYNLAYASYSYTMTLAKGKFLGVNNHKRGIELAIGTFVGAKQYGLDLTNINDNTDVSTIDLENMNKIMPDASLGAWLYFGNDTYAGLSVQQLFRNKLVQDSRLVQHYNIVFGTAFFLDQDVRLLPSFMAKKVMSAPISFDFNCKLEVNETYFVGASYRTQDALSFLVGYLFQEKYEIAYSYDFLLSTLRKHSMGGHEITLGLRIHPRLSYRNPQW